MTVTISINDVLPHPVLIDILSLSNNPAVARVCKLWNAFHMQICRELWFEYQKSFLIRPLMPTMDWPKTDLECINILKDTVDEAKDYYKIFVDNSDRTFPRTYLIDPIALEEWILKAKQAEQSKQVEADIALIDFLRDSLAQLPEIHIPVDVPPGFLEGGPAETAAAIRTHLPQAVQEALNRILCINTDKIPPETGVLLKNLCRLCCRKSAVLLRDLRGIGRLSTLHTLELKNCNLSLLPGAVCRLSNLRSLDLSQNKLTELPRTIVKLINLQSLDLRGNPINSAARVRLAQLHQHNPACRIMRDSRFVVWCHNNSFACLMNILATISFGLNLHNYFHSGKAMNLSVGFVFYFFIVLINLITT